MRRKSLRLRYSPRALQRRPSNVGFLFFCETVINKLRRKGLGFFKFNTLHSTDLPRVFLCQLLRDRPLSSWCRWPRSIIYLDQRKRQGCGASNKARGCNRCNASWCACCFVHHGWYSLFIYTAGITGEFMLQASNT